MQPTAENLPPSVAWAQLTVSIAIKSGMQNFLLDLGEDRKKYFQIS
jgi:hypothetical protein